MRRRPERIRFRVARAGTLPPDTGVMVPADGLAAGRLRSRKYHTGSIVFAELRKPRNPGFHALAHAFGQLLADNIEPFNDLDAHTVLKRLQVESGAGCEKIAAKIGSQIVPVNVPISISFESMDQGEFDEVFAQLVDHVRREYWPTETNQAIKDMAEEMLNGDHA